ncbi:hypothetical protein MTR72_16720 [Bradyrhizobium sp. ISRA442]|uniref:hypothetical protein n=1 Tax=Bradyrhizobium sp. ISRA442 TaxID=2866197 RepID=UPI00311AF06C
MRDMAPSYRARPCPASRTGSSAVSGKISPAISAPAHLFRPEADHETKRTANETILRIREDVPKLAMVTDPPNE